MASTFKQADWGIQHFWRLKRGSVTQPDHLTINSVANGKSVRINTRDYDSTTGDSIAVSSKANQMATTTGEVVGFESSPRVTDAGSASLVAYKGDPLLKTATSGRTVGAVRSFQSDISFPSSGSAYTVTAETCALYVFPDFGSGHTFTGKKSVIKLATPNNGAWDYLLDVATNGIAVGSAGTYSTADGYFLIRVPAGDMRIPFFAGTD